MCFALSGFNCFPCRRELSDGLYRPITYLVAKVLDEFALVFVLSIIFAAAVFCAPDSILPVHKPLCPCCCSLDEYIS